MAGSETIYDYDVFLSHASANKRWVEVLARNLAGQGLRVFYDEWCLKPGGALVGDLYDGLKRSRTGILVVSPEAANSGWVSKEYGHMLNRQASHREFVIVPVVYGELMEFPFLSDILWVDFRAPNDYRKAFHRLLCGLRGEAPGRVQRFEGELEIPGSEAATPLEERAQDFFDEIFEALDSASTLLLLAQADRASGPVIQALLERARRRFGETNTLHLAPPIDPQADTPDYFGLLAQQCGFDATVRDAVDFQGALHRRLASGEPLFLLVSGFENGAEEGRRLLAGMLRTFSDMFFSVLRVVICGSERLAELKYAQGTLSMLNHAEDREWPELTVADVHRLQAQCSLGHALPAEEAALVLRVSGGHPRLLRYCLERRKQSGASGALDERGYREALVKSSVVFQLFNPFKRDPQAVARLCDWLKQDDLGPAQPFINDSLLRRLYWKSLLRKVWVGNEERLCWRCAALREAGKAILGCD